MSADVINITTQINSRTFEPMVTLRWGSMAGQLAPEEAMQHGLAVIHAAESAIQEANLVRFFDEKVQLSTVDTARILAAWREFREQRKATR